MDKILDDWYLVNAKFGVSENGSVWVEEYKKELFLSENVLIILKGKIFDTLEEAIEFIDKPGVFISGPSKTADVESFLVYGAHGPKRVGIFFKI